MFECAYGKHRRRRLGSIYQHAGVLIYRVRQDASATIVTPAGFDSIGYELVDKATLTRAIADVLAGGLSVPANLPNATLPASFARKAPIAERVASLTPQQVRVLAMIRQGKLNKQIAHELQVGDSTVKAHVSEILRKLDVISRTQIVIETALLDFDRILASPEG